uniref:Uncharacterized protein n=1 Tax=Ditylenchus dipsaci TaxID=166011 RepID=A0A915E0F1_9BILA
MTTTTSFFDTNLYSKNIAPAFVIVLVVGIHSAGNSLSSATERSSAASILLPQSAFNSAEQDAGALLKQKKKISISLMVNAASLPATPSSQDTAICSRVDCSQHGACLNCQFPAKCRYGEVVELNCTTKASALVYKPSKKRLFVGIAGRLQNMSMCARN